MIDKLSLSLVGIAIFSFAFVTNPQAAAAGCNSGTLGAVAYGQSGASVQTLQQCLLEAGYSIPAGVTGYYGEQTRAAVKQFYSQALTMPEWDGGSVGPVGRGKLAALAAGTVGAGAANPLSGYKTLSSADELKKYLSADRVMQAFSDDVRMAPTTADAAGVSSAESTVNRVSETNVQVVGIDEPDIVKTDGESIFIGNQSQWFGIMPMVRMGSAVVSDMSMPYYQPLPTTIVDALPVTDLAVASKAIKETGEMLLVNEQDILIIFSRPNIVAYDVKDPKNPSKKWELTLDDNTSIVTSRLQNGQVYLVTETYLNQDRPCPVTPMRWSGGSLDIACTGILIPQTIEPVSSLYTVMKVNPKNGATEGKTTVAGNNGGITVMMSKDNLFIASRAEASRYQIMSKIVIDSMRPIVSASTVAKAEKIQSYDISETGKLDEITKVLQSYLQTLSSDEQLRIQNELANNQAKLVKSHLREMYRSRIVRIGLDTLQIKATGSVPGYLLNQFAMDEYNGHLRVAVTVDDGWGGTESLNDVYVLDGNLSQTGKIQDLGLGERIYSVRFIEDKGYLVTFRQTDPFYVLDLHSASEPKMAGQLKIPGYSAYLEPLGNNLVLGVGREGSGVKLSIFDVNNPAVPVEKSKYQLNDYWTEVESNHRAFLRDEKHEVFFIPGGDGGYIFSYKNGLLKLNKALSGYGIKRALYINDYMYVVSDDKVRVLDESNWEEIKSLSI